MAVGKTISGNRVLDVFLRENPSFQTAMQPVTYETGRVIYRQDKPISHAYFPVTGWMSLTILMRDGGDCEAISVGAEGVVGLPLYFGLDFSPHAVSQQAGGRSYRLAAPIFLETIRRSSAVQQVMQRYSAYTMHFAQQTAACNSLHSIRQRACRWLLVVHDRSGSERLELPQAMLAELLAVRRQSISEVAAQLRRDGLIEYSRGLITIVNRRKLEAAACCECYGVMNAYYDRLLPRAA
ncbi:MAG: Crp/Fnr family transcriptional regulator [Steroidobacteraceae bacterium]